MKLGSVVIISLAKLDEVFASLGHEVAVKLQVQVPLVRG
jgi:hypothetical protein